MHCPSCNRDNPDDAKFCVSCGSPFARRCAKCGAENPSDASFCKQCGTALAGTEVSSRSSSPPQATTEVHVATAGNDAFGLTDGERRHLTVLFCDLVGSTEIAARLDPEEWRSIAARYQRSAAEAVTRMGGHVAEYLGDGLVVYFGWPEAHEDDAERAVRAGLAVIDAIALLNTRFTPEQGVELSVRAGIDSGSVVVGRGGSNETRIFGQTPNIAARLQATAEPDSVLITAAVHQLVSGLFVVEDRGAQTLKGIAHPVQLYRVIQPTAARRQTHRAANATQAPFVGRDDEMRLLLSRWERAREGEGQLALVVGEPGIGKSRLIQEFRARIRDEPHLWIECAGEQFSANTPFHAVIQMLDQGLGWRGDESKEDRVVQLEGALELARLKLGEAVPLIAEMLNLPLSAKYPPLMFSPDQKRRRLLANLATWVLNAARLQPMVIVLEDLHWVDPSTLELIHTLVEQAATAPLLLLYTTRPEFRAPWPMRAHHVQITLNRLSERHTREMIAGVAARTALAKEVIDAVVKRTDGVPLFAEELTRLMLEGDGRKIVREIPVTLQDSLMARLDRLGPAKEVAQVGAVLGREFSYELLQAVSSMPEAELQAALTKLTDAELIYSRGIAPEAQYQFKHALIQDAAYQALLKSRRRELHRRAAETMVQKFPAAAEAQPEVLARHFSEAGDAEPAIAAWKKAGDVADARQAFKEAEQAYQEALEMLSTLPESAQRDGQELALHNALWRVLVLTRGYVAPKAFEVTARVRSLAERSGSLSDLVQQLYSTWAGAVSSGDALGSGTLADRLLDLARQEGSPSSFAKAHYAQILARFYRGRLVEVEDHWRHWNTYGEAPGFLLIRASAVIARGYGGLNSWMSGYADSSRRRMAEMIAFALATEDPYEIAFARYLESWLHYLLREASDAMAAAYQALALCEEHEFPFPGAMSQGILGWAQAQLCSPGEGVSLIRRSLERFVEISSRVNITDILTRLAEAQLLDGAIDDALTTVQDALQANPEELVFLPNILTRRGELRLKLGQNELAEADFREAIALGQKMSAKAWELRATTSLARLLRDTNRRGEARAMLAEIYNWFTEGFDTADLKDAKALLNELSK
jgi:class 3 adenylate cyclase/tetratricopeptide (TPR) repeat protein